jgi:molecular chaperone GrpE
LTNKKKKETEVEITEREEEQVGTESVEEEASAEVGEIGELQDALAQAEAQAAEYLDGWQRAQAEFSNYKKRQEADRAQMMAFASTGVLNKLLPAMDDFERALGTLPDDLRHLTWCEGLFLIKQKLDGVLESEGVAPIESEGQMFDPRYHEAVTYEEAPGYEEGQIIGEVQRGYMIGERVLRPALVRVAKASADASAAQSE